MFNFLLGGIYLDNLSKNNDYFVNAFGLDYASGILGAASSAAIPGVKAADRRPIVGARIEAAPGRWPSDTQCPRLRLTLPSSARRCMSAPLAPKAWAISLSAPSSIASISTASRCRRPTPPTPAGTLRVSLTLRPAEKYRVRAVAARYTVAPGAEEFLPPSDSGLSLPPQRTFSSLDDRAPLLGLQAADAIEN